jgi:hypothetical protein
MAPTPSDTAILRKYAGVTLLLVAVGVWAMAVGSSTRTQTAWVLGGGILGLLSGFVTGASNQPGTAGQFLAFISGGVLVPLFGGAVALMQFRQGTMESYTYSGEQVLTKTTQIQLPANIEHVHPIWVLGSFFIAYGLGAILGILAGMYLRDSAGFVIRVR